MLVGQRVIVIRSVALRQELQASVQGAHGTAAPENKGVWSPAATGNPGRKRTTGCGSKNAYPK